jgi:hypothetical protein
MLNTSSEFLVEVIIIIWVIRVENQFQNPKEKMVERCKVDSSNTKIHDCLLSRLVMGRMDLLSQQILC